MLYFQVKKSQIIDSYKCDEALIEMQTRNRIKVAHSDQGGEFLSNDLTRHQDMRGTKHELTVHDSPQQNGVAEHRMRTCAECVWALLLASGLPWFLWEEAIKHTTWLQNCTPARAINGKTPYEMQHKKKPHLAGIQEFRVAAYIKDLKAGKLYACAKVGRFVGYDLESKGYWIYWPQKQSITIKCNVVFNESDVTANDNIHITVGDAVDKGERDKVLQPPTSNTNAANVPNSAPAPQPKAPDITPEPALQPEPQNSVPFPSEQEPAKELLPEPLQEEDRQLELGRGRRIQKKPPGAYKWMAQGLPPLDANIADLQNNIPEDKEDWEVELPPDFALIGALGTEPKSLDDVLSGPHAKEWQTMLDYKIGQLKKLGTWVIEDLPKGHNVISCSAMLKEKCSPDGEITSYWVHIVAGGHRQVQGVNYSETFLSMAKMPTIQVILANAATQDWEIEHADVKSAYLNATLKETIYMKLPWGVLKPGEEGKVCHLVKGLYGLKQAGHGWYQEMSWVLVKDLGFTRSTVDHLVFFWHSSDEHTIIAVATDDMAVTSKQAEDVTRFKADIQHYWEITDNRPICWFLGFQILCDHTAQTISINQSMYIQAMVNKFRLTNSAPVTTPMVTGATFLTADSPSTPTQVARVRGIPYAEVISSALWPVVVSRPDAAFAVSTLLQFIQNPGPTHWEELKHVIIFLSSTKDLWLTFGRRSKPAVEGFCDADWGGQKHHHSISGYLFHMGAGAISWSSKKQHVVALSSTEAEYITQTHMAKEALSLCSFLWELRSMPDDPLILNCDNQGVITLAKDN